MHAETPRRVYERYRREGMAFKRIFPESHFSIYDFVRLTLSNIGRDLHEAGRQRTAWRHVRFDRMVSNDAVLGNIPGISAIRGPITQALAANVLLSPEPQHDSSAS